MLIKSHIGCSLVLIVHKNSVEKVGRSEGVTNYSAYFESYSTCKKVIIRVASKHIWGVSFNLTALKYHHGALPQKYFGFLWVDAIKKELSSLPSNLSFIKGTTKETD